MAAMVVAAPSWVPHEFAGHKRGLTGAADGIRTVRPRERVRALDERVRDDLFPSSSARPTQSVNVRVPIARACPETTVSGSVAFVMRGQVTSVLSLEGLNELLSQPENEVELEGKPMDAMFTDTRARSLYLRNDPSTKREKMVRQRARRFDPEKLLKSAKLFSHPVVEHALDGIVATDPTREPVGRLGAMCNVAVAGPCPLTLNVLHGSAPNPVTWVANPVVYVAKKTVVLERVYVCLVAIRVGGAPSAPSAQQQQQQQEASPSRWRFRYEVVFESGMHAFEKTTALRKAPTNAAPVAPTATKILLRTHELGRVVDSNFGIPSQPAVVVSVAIREAEPVDHDSNAVSDPLVVHTLLERQTRTLAKRGRPRKQTPSTRDFPVAHRAFALRRKEGVESATGVRVGGLEDDFLEADAEGDMEGD